MAVSIHLYSNFPVTLLTDKLGDLSGETTLKCLLTTSTYTPSQDNHDYHSDITNELAAAGNYSTGGEIMTTTTVGATARVTTFDATDTQWTSASFTARYAVIYDYTGGSSATNALVGYIDFGEDKTVENGTFKLAWNGSGILTVTVAAG